MTNVPATETTQAEPGFQIKDWKGDVLFTSSTALNVSECLAEAVKAEANLYGANLEGANLYGANLVRANLEGANLVRANLEGANLEGANLYGANLVRANLYGAKIHGEDQTITPIQLLGLTWPVLISRSSMQIGCQLHTHEEWRGFSDAKIKKMEGRALTFWQENKAVLMMLCDAHKAKSEAAQEATND